MSRTKIYEKIELTIIALCIIFVISIISDNKEIPMLTSANYEKTIGWGIKRENNHLQPDVGSKNKQILEENNGICMGRDGEKIIYLTFDSGYEAGYMDKILTTLKENNVKATFFITAHYLNSATEEVEKMVNEKIAEDLTVSTEIMSVDEAKNTGAMALFGEKYGDKVRVVTMGDFSKEFCAGTHVPHTGVIKAFKIISETGVAAGIRRIEALTGDGVMKYYLDEEKTLHEAAKAAKAEPHKLAEKIQSMLDEIKALSAENEKLKDQIAKSEVADVMDQVVEAGDYKVLPVSVKDVDMNALRTLGDDLKGKIGSGVVILASDMGGKVNLIVTATDDAVKAGAHAGKIIKEAAALVGGGGGGRPNMAQAGGKNPAGIKAALEKAVEIAKEQL